MLKKIICISMIAILMFTNTILAESNEVSVVLPDFYVHLKTSYALSWLQP